MKLPGYNTKNKEKRKVLWSDSVYITVDKETAYYAATQHTDIFAIVEDTQILITLSCPTRQNPNAEETTLDTSETVTTHVMKQHTAPNMPAKGTPVALTEAT